MTTSPSEQPAAAARPPTRPLVLITEDDEDTRELFRTVLQLRGWGVIEAADGEEAVRLAESARPDLILLDGSMPLLDGLEAARRIRRFGGDGRRVPIVFVTGHAEPSYGLAAREAGGDACLVKPLKLEELRGVLEKFLKGGVVGWTV